MSHVSKSDDRADAESSVRARMPTSLKQSAEEIIRDAGLTPSQAIRLYYAHIIRSGHFPSALEAKSDD